MIIPAGMLRPLPPKNDASYLLQIELYSGASALIGPNWAQ